MKMQVDVAKPSPDSMGSASPNISVIIPAYNNEETIAEALTSVLQQTYVGKIEVIVIDDGSTDATRQVVEGLALRRPEIRYMANFRTKGPAGARNSGLLSCKGEFVAFLDADDIWLPMHVDQGVGFLEANGDVDAVIFDVRVHDVAGSGPDTDWFADRTYPRALKAESADNGFWLIRDDVVHALILESFAHLQSLIVRRSSIGDTLFYEEVSRSEDRDFAINLFKYERRFLAYSNMITGVYNQRYGSLSSPSTENQILINQDHIKLFLRYLEDDWLGSKYRTLLSNLIYERELELCYLCRKRGQVGSSLMHLARSVKWRRASVQVTELLKIVFSVFAR